MSETTLLRRIMLAATDAGWRLLRNNCGVLQDKRGRYVRFGVGNPGGSDLIGYRIVVITPAMVGQRIAQFAAIEGKEENGLVSKEQRLFLDSVLAAGGIAEVVRSQEEFINLLRRYK